MPQILQALPWAIDGGLRLPIVYNTSCYDSLESPALMDGIVDIYLPDLKVWTPGRARRYLRMPGYPQAAGGGGHGDEPPHHDTRPTTPSPDCRIPRIGRQLSNHRR